MVFGSCLSRCIVNDMATELEIELDESGRNLPAKHELHSTPANGTTSTTFGTTSLLAADEVMCLNMIGEGPSGVIYKGSYRGSPVAVKQMKMISMPTHPSAREAIESALEIEASRMGSLRHPNTVLFMGACLQGDYFCIVSEYCSHGSLYNVLHNPNVDTSPSRNKRAASKDSMPPRVNGTSGNTMHSFHTTDSKKKKSTLKWSLRIRLALGAARGLLYLHSAEPPLVHGQLKSTNILVDDSWNAKLADFGTRRVAEAVGFDRRRLEKVDSDTGLLRWTAPELLKLGEERVFKGKLPSGHVSPQAVDVYSFGIVLWELTTGELPFADCKSNHEIRDRLLQGLRPPMTPGNYNIKWADLIVRCWSDDPLRRPTAAEIVSTLEIINKEESLVQAEKRKARVVNSNRADYRFADRKHSKARNASKFRTNVRVPEL
ncbi:hypothetical protein Poli38472_005719 [Pythium oligandrum]|uniref:Protein kinase domain-containing protein n=1 Tax=Pythium oligandrum TaxID=41045 RepID=A0A8K1FMH5_PYTOL|nr:hypothetical protein Poli38472_005719 [Pythium oligandrum]|eukprot:TMW68251.1 hypothetical protein Poli38472_005719 [Pythium oligandrum]